LTIADRPASDGDGDFVYMDAHTVPELIRHGVFVQTRLKSGSLVEPDFLCGEKREAGSLRMHRCPCIECIEPCITSMRNTSRIEIRSWKRDFCGGVIAGAKDDMRSLGSGSTAIRRNL